jgi:predicted  nucleic acid-binding Zn-ribbon protein
MWILLFNYILTLKKYLLISSKCSFIIISLYYLYHFKDYAITFNIPLWLRNYSWINNSLIYIENIGMLFLIVPLVILIMSFYDDESRILKILSGIFSFSGSIFALFHSLSYGLLEDRFRAGFLTIFHEVKLTDKIKLFQLAFDTKVQEYASSMKDPLKYQEFIQAFVIKNWTSYIEKLKLIGIGDVDKFATDTVHSIVTQYRNAYVTLGYSSPDDRDIHFWLSIKDFTVKTVITFTIIAAAAAGIWWIYKKLKEGAILSKDIATNQIELSNIQNQALLDTKASLETTQKVALNVDDIRGILDNFHERVKTLEKLHNTNYTVLQQQIEKFRPLADLNVREFFQTTIEQHKLFMDGLLSNVKNIENHTKDLSTLETAVNKLTTDLTGLTESLRTRILSVESSNQLASAAENRRIMEALTKIDRIDKTKLVGEVMDKVTGNLNKVTTELKGDISKIQDNVNSTSKAMGNVHTRVTTTQVKFDAIQEQVNSIQTDNIALLKSHSTMSDILTSQNETINEHATKIGKTQYNVAIVRDEVATTEKGIADIRSQIADLNSANYNVRHDITSVNLRLNSAQKGITELRTDQQALRTEVTNNLSTFSEQLSEIKNSITKRFTTVPSSIAGIMPMIRGIRQDNRNITSSNPIESNNNNNAISSSNPIPPTFSNNLAEAANNQGV